MSDERTAFELRADCLETDGRSPAPSVGELEWRDNDGDFVDASESWRIEVWADTPNILLLWFSERGWIRMVEGCESVPAAKSLAHSLQRILSGAAE